MCMCYFVVIKELSKRGIEVCAEELAAEVRREVLECPSLRRISMVGMSLGGLISRYAAKLLYDSAQGTIAGLLPETFICIASPFLGVKSHTFLPIPRFLERLIGNIIGDTGRELFLMGNRKELVYFMNTDEEYLQPLRSFKSRRLYAAIENDFMVPLPTAAVLDCREVENIRKEYKDKRGIVAVVYGCFSGEGKEATPTSNDPLNTPDDLQSTEMRNSLNSLGWSKVFVNFGGLLPLAHLQICANERWPDWVTRPMGVDAGREVMDHAALYLCTRGGEE